ncbi:unnamed protein product [Protopolystoma xenopodis]|uniref:Uncharacterized protein n=1 Tax=Protopolystoma xenopodis TaxID=117903 RepID=A0A3S5C1U3_9PLAT|nr:unnamed protein product [Protopolystoma xenopodis]
MPPSSHRSLQLSGGAEAPLIAWSRQPFQTEKHSATSGPNYWRLDFDLNVQVTIHVYREKKDDLDVGHCFGSVNLILVNMLRETGIRLVTSDTVSN